MTKYYYQLHFSELKFYLFLSSLCFLFNFGIIFLFINECIYFFLYFFLELEKMNYFIFTEITEVFFFQIYFSFFLSLLFTTPFLILQFWRFFSPGCYKYENKKILFLVIFLIFLTIVLSFIFFNKIMPNIWTFFINLNEFNKNYIFQIHYEPKLIEFFAFYINIYIYMLITFHFFFLILYILINLNIKLKNFIFFRKVFYLIILIISALISPPDIISQVLLSLPFFILFELFLYFLIFSKKYKNLFI